MSPAVPRARQGLPGTRALLSVLRTRAGTAVVSLAVVIAVWEAYGRSNPLFSSYPTAIAAAAAAIVVPDILPALAVTMTGFAVGFAIALPAGVLLGIAMGLSRFIDLVLGPYVNALYVTPRIALIPLLVLWFGLDFYLRVAIVTLSAIFPIIVTTYAGMHEVDQDLLDVGRAFTATAAQRLRTIVLPGSLPYIFTGVRNGLAHALGGIIVAEMSASITGIGRLLTDYGTFFKTDRLFVAVIAIGIVGLVLTSGLASLQDRAAPWIDRERERAR